MKEKYDKLDFKKIKKTSTQQTMPLIKYKGKPQTGRK